MMPQITTDVASSWRSSLPLLGTGLGLLLGAFISNAMGISVLPYLLGAAGILVFLFKFLIGFKGGTAPCPVCRQNVTFLLGDGDRYVLCKKCGEYLQARDRKCFQMELKHLADTPQFAVPLPWRDLENATSPLIATDIESFIYDKVMTKKGDERIVPANWPPGCCVCRAKATRKGMTQLKLITRGKGAISIRDVEVVLMAEDIPYCDTHKNGAAIGMDYGFNVGTRWVLKFRSYAYRNEFRYLNSWANPWQ